MLFWVSATCIVSSRFQSHTPSNLQSVFVITYNLLSVFNETNKLNKMCRKKWKSLLFLQSWIDLKIAFFCILRATSEAEAIIAQYEKEAEAYQKILSNTGLGFTIEGFISYLGIRVIADAKNPVFIGLQSPAKSSYAPP